NVAAQEDAAPVEILADYGYANPTFTAADVCPVLNVEAPLIEPRTAEGAEEAEMEAEPAEPSAETATESTAEEAAETTETPDPADTDEAAGDEEDALTEALIEDLPECPATLAEYADVFPALLEETADPLVVETWLRVCD